MNRSTQHGFTLLELLVAIGILAVIGIIAHQGLLSVSTSYAAVSNRGQDIADLTMTMALLERDSLAAIDRPVRDELGDDEPGLSGERNRLALTRVGWDNPLGLTRSELQRVEWRLIGKRLHRLSWNVLDRTQGSSPLVADMLGDVERLQVRFFDPTRETWTDRWPPVNNAIEGFEVTWPRGLHIRIERADGAVFERFFELPQGLGS